MRRLLLVLLATLGLGCGDQSGKGIEVTLPVSVLGAESRVLRAQLARFAKEHPEIRVVQRDTPDAADQRHQLYVQWLNAGASDPDILQLDAIWTPEFAAAGWILPLERFAPDTSAFFPVTIEANRWARLPVRDARGSWTWACSTGAPISCSKPPATFDELRAAGAAARESGKVRHGCVWQGARYEGLVTTFLEYLGGYGGTIMEGGRVVVASPAGVRALREMIGEIYRERDRPAGRADLARGGDPVRVPERRDGDDAQLALCVRPDGGQRPVGRRGPLRGGTDARGPRRPVHGRSGRSPARHQPERRASRGGLEGDRVSHPPRADARARRRSSASSLPASGCTMTRDLARALSVPPADARRIIERAVPRPVTPVYTELSEILQIHLHRALTGQRRPERALADAQAEMQRLLDDAGLGSGAGHASP